jgi:hypothetical protein
MNSFINQSVSLDLGGGPLSEELFCFSLGLGVFLETLLGARRLFLSVSSYLVAPLQILGVPEVRHGRLGVVRRISDDFIMNPTGFTKKGHYDSLRTSTW